MAYLDDVRTERRQWAAEERQAHQAHQDSVQQPDSTTTPATSHVRTQARWILAIGLPCLIPPATPIGVFLVVVGGLLLLFSPVMAKAENAAHQATVAEVKQGTGNGCGAVLWTCLVVSVIVIGVVLAALGAAQG